MATPAPLPSLPPVKPSQPRQSLGMHRLHLLPAKAPFPVAFTLARQVHAVFAAQTQHILQWVNRGVGDAGAGGADQLPVDVVAVADDIASQNRQQSLPLVCR